MGSVCSAFHWAPSDFWRSTMHEIVAAVEAHTKE